jgi:hypothetical protein
MTQGCGLSPFLFNVYINRIPKEWKLTVETGIQLTRSKSLLYTLYFSRLPSAVISENELQKAAHHLKK